jgi:hypothetical protein
MLRMPVPALPASGMPQPSSRISRTSACALLRSSTSTRRACAC